MSLAEQIKDALELRQVMEHYGVRFNGRGYAKCPFHTEKTASLSLKKGRYTCFGCGATGDVIEFVLRYFNLDFGQALVRLNNDFSLGLTAEKPTVKSQAISKERARRRQQEKVRMEHDRKVYLLIAGAHARLIQLGTDEEVLRKIEDWLDDNIEMVVVR
jgi:DNA primase